MVYALLFAVLFPCRSAGLLLAASNETRVRSWVSSEDMSLLLSEREPILFGRKADKKLPLIEIEGGKEFQSILGLGSSLEHSTCYNLSRLPLEEQKEALRRIVHPDDGIGMNLMRICIGTPDFTASPWYTYADVAEGETDPDLASFSIAKDREYVLPILKMALEINPDLLFVASSWSPPGWMTSNGKIGGGAILPEHFASLAEYLSRFVQAYEAEGIPIHAITPQNEPNFNPPSYPTCLWTGEQQRDFIRDHLGPAFRKHGIETQIWCWDHNWNHLDFPRTILSDGEAAKYVKGTAFHHYEGRPEAMSQLQKEFPDKEIHFTEGSTFRCTGATKLIAILRNGSRSYNAWVTVIDQDLQPNPGPHMCSPTCILLHQDELKLEYRFDYYMYGQFMKFIERNSVCIASSGSEGRFANVALKNPDGSIVLIVVNAYKKPKRFAVRWGKRAFEDGLPGKSICTYTWE